MGDSQSKSPELFASSRRDSEARDMSRWQARPGKWARQPPRISSMLSLRLEQKKLPFLFLYPSHKVLASSWQFPISHWELAPAGNHGFLGYWACSWFLKYSWGTMINFVTVRLKVWAAPKDDIFICCTWGWWVGWNSPLCIWLVLSVKLFFLSLSISWKPWKSIWTCCRCFHYHFTWYYSHPSNLA